MVETASPQTTSIACHTCRRRRWKCDRSLPTCLKCQKKGQECLGYQQLLRWEQGMASRGRYTGKTTFDEAPPGDLVQQGRSTSSSSIAGDSPQETSRESDTEALFTSLPERLLGNLGYSSRKYLHYFSGDVCRDLVLYDDGSQSNPFRELILWAEHDPSLLLVMVAISAQHMSNAAQRFKPYGETHLRSETMYDQARKSQTESHGDLQQVALIAKQQALESLKSSLFSGILWNADASLATILLFIELELLDSGQNGWVYHVMGARSIIESLYGTDLSLNSSISPLRRTLISNCLIFDVIGSTLSCSVNQRPSDITLTGPISLLQDTEGNHCSGFPVELLGIVQAAARLLSKSDHTVVLPPTEAKYVKQDMMKLLAATKAFIPLLWATTIQRRSISNDITSRTHLAMAHQAAVCIYISRVFLCIFPSEAPPDDLEVLVNEIISHLSTINREDTLFTALPWPTFIAGAEANAAIQRQWASNVFKDLWNVMPWGIIKGASGLLESIWQSRDQISEDADSLHPSRIETNWVQDLRNSGVNWLII